MGADVPAPRRALTPPHAAPADARSEERIMPCGDSEFLMWRRANGTRVGLQLSFGHPGELKATACDGSAPPTSAPSAARHAPSCASTIGGAPKKRR